MQIMARKGSVKSMGGAVAKVTISTSKTTKKNTMPLEIRIKAQKARAVKSVQKKAGQDLGCIGKASGNLERDAINLWLDSKPYLVSYVAGVMRNGLLEKSYVDSIAVPVNETASHVGIRIFAEGATKMRAIKTSATPKLLSRLLGMPALESWFKGEDRLCSNLAQKALLFLLGVEDGNNIPKKNDLWMYFEPFLTLCRAYIGNHPKIDRATLTKGNFDTQSDWFFIKADGLGVGCNTVPKIDVAMAGIDFKAAAD
jgi:hypothetical protein